MYINNIQSLNKQKEIMKIRIGERLRVFRRAKGWTQQQLGRLFEIPSSTVSKMETGQSSVPAEMIPLMSDQFGVVAEVFFCEDTHEPYGYDVIKNLLYKMMDKDAADVEAKKEFIKCYSCFEEMMRNAENNVGHQRLFDFLYISLLYAAEGENGLKDIEFFYRVMNEADIPRDKSIFYKGFQERATLK